MIVSGALGLRRAAQVWAVKLFAINHCRCADACAAGQAWMAVDLADIMGGIPLWERYPSNLPPQFGECSLSMSKTRLSKSAGLMPAGVRYP